jgi:hypothetical protein
MGHSDINSDLAPVPEARTLPAAQRSLRLPGVRPPAAGGTTAACAAGSAVLLLALATRRFRPDQPDSRCAPGCAPAGDHHAAGPAGRAR